MNIDGGIISENVEKIIDDKSINQVNELSHMLINAVNNRNYLVISAILLMFVIIFLNKVILPKLSKDKLYKPYLPLITFSLSLVTGIITWILNPNTNLIEILTTVFAATTMASGSWETIMKPLFNIKKK